MGEPERAFRLLAHRVGRGDEAHGVVGDERHVRQREEQAADQLDPRLAPQGQLLREGVDAGMRIDHVAVAHPQREDRRVEVPFQLLELRQGDGQTGLAREHVEAGHDRHDDEQPAGGVSDDLERPPQAFRYLQESVHRVEDPKEHHGLDEGPGIAGASRLTVGSGRPFFR